MKKRTSKKSKVSVNKGRSVGYKMACMTILVSFLLLVFIAVMGVTHYTKPWDWPIWHILGIK